MAADGVNIATDDAEMAECDGDKVVTMMDVLQEQQDFEEDANAVLGASDDKNCTYSKGYIKRQALYACLTCCAEAKTDPTKRAGVCLACSLNCHENHELIELYTKRNFRCDCGNPKFNSHPCTYTQEKVDLNDENIYNQNFSGLYCICQRPYPDPESNIEDDMIQCIICEDWLHASHLETVVPANDQYAEMVCKACMEKNEFLHDYSLLAVHVETGDVDVDVTINGEAESPHNSLCNGEPTEEKLVNGIDENKTEIDSANVTVNGDVEMNDDTVNSKVKDDGLENIKTDENISPEANQKTNQNDAESKLEETDNSNSKVGLDTENNKTGEGDKSNISTISNDLAETNETSAIPESSHDKDKNILAAQHEDTHDISDIEPKLSNETSPDKETDEKTDRDDKMEDTIHDEALKDNETKEQNVEESKTHCSKDVNTNNVDKTDQELLDDLSTLTDENPASESLNKDTATDDNLTEQDKDNKIEKINEDLPKESGDTSQEKPVPEEKIASANIEVPDTSQSKTEEKENTDDKTDSVMDAIDELLQTKNETKESENTDENKESTNELIGTKESIENVETTDSKDVEMSTEKNKMSEKADETTEILHAATTNDGTKDIEMTDASDEKESSVNDNKEDKDREATDSLSKTETPLIENESPKDDENPDITDTVNENICKEKENGGLDIIDENDSDKKDKSEENNDANKTDLSSNDNTVPNLVENSKEHKRKLSADLADDISSKKAKLECVRPKGVKRIHKGATFWPSNFRQKLCTCAECLTMYKDLKVLFLTDLEDTVFAYESLGKENVAGGASQYEKGLQALSSLDRIQQINALTEYNKMRDKLLDFLKSFKDRKEIVKEEDIKAFFAGMKPRREPDGVYFCR